MAASMAQLNVRMDAQLKTSGDVVLERMGISPTQLVRAVWSKVAQGARACDQLIEALAADSRSDEEVGRTSVEDNSTPMTFAAGVRARQEQFAQEVGLSLSTFVPHTDEELDELVYLDWLSQEQEGRYGAGS